MVILVDLGSTNNFLDPLVVRRGNLEVKEDDRVNVKVANGELFTSEQSCLELKFKVQGINFSIEVQVLVLAGCDMVLGVKWLRELGTIL